jgi:hypothetical protein
VRRPEPDVLEKARDGIRRTKPRRKDDEEEFRDLDRNCFRVLLCPLAAAIRGSNLS